jgi:hypothetical protein
MRKLSSMESKVAIQLIIVVAIIILMVLLAVFFL